MTKDNHLLGKFNLEGIPPAPKGVPKIEVTFEIDANGILNVTAVDNGTGKQNNIIITNDTGRLSKEEIKKMSNDVEKFKNEDEIIKKRIKAKNAFENCCFQMKNTLNEEKFKTLYSEDDMKVIEGAVNENLLWLEVNAQALPEEIEKKQKDFEA